MSSCDRQFDRHGQADREADSRESWPHQTRAHCEVTAAIEPGRAICVTSPTGGGKCLGRDTPVRMFDGSVRAVQDIKFGDLLLGPDSKARMVVGTGQGIGPLFRVTPSKGDSYIVNDAHILTLKMTGGSRRSTGMEDGSLIDISIQEYIAATKSFRHCAKGVRVGVDYAAERIPIDPYFFGLWLGDGTSRSVEITTADAVIAQVVEQFAADNQLRVAKRQQSGNASSTIGVRGVRGNCHSNVVSKALRVLGVWNNKHIPQCYKVNSRAVRLRVLAGLIDADGHLHHNFFELTLKNYKLAADATEIARSLGLAAYIRQVHKTCTNNGVSGRYWKVSISGDVARIPTKLTRKQAQLRTQKKDVLVTGIHVEPIGEGEYFGFELAGADRRFLLGDFTVTHNTRMQTDLIWWAREQDRRVMLLTNRRMLLEQTERVLGQAGINFGVRAAGHASDDFSKVQLSSVQTEIARSNNENWKRFEADLVIVDEAHQQATGKSQELIESYLDSGASVVGYTATPIDLAHLYDDLIVAGTTRELRECGALIPCDTWGPDEPSYELLKAIGAKSKTGEYTEAGVRKVIMTPTIFGRVFECFERLNPEHRPTILFAPDVPSSIWFAEQFAANGISAAHIDGENVSYGNLDEEGESVTVKTSPERRAEILAASREGKIKILCNRFVMREGIDAPWLSHGIFATVIGGLSSYLQAGGRLLRKHPGLDRVTIQDHGGNWHRHGSLNVDRQWNLSWGNRDYAEARETALCGKKEREPIRCAKCGMIRSQGDTCPKCQHRQSRQSRMVVQLDGCLHELRGDIYKPKKPPQEFSDTQKKWDAIFWRFHKSGRTFAQAFGFFRNQHHYEPPRTLGNMPLRENDWQRKIKSVPWAEIRRREEASARPAETQETLF